MTAPIDEGLVEECFQLYCTTTFGLPDDGIRAVLAHLAATGRLTEATDEPGHNKPCAFCGEPCNSWAANPGLWPLCFTHRDGTGLSRWHHTKCVQDRLFSVPQMTSPVDEGLVEEVAPIIDECCNEARNGRYIARAVLVHLAATGRLTEANPGGWQPIAGALEGSCGIFWIEFTDDVAPLNPNWPWHEGHINIGKNGCWPSICKATHWMPFPAPPSPADPPEGKVERRVKEPQLLKRIAQYWNTKMWDWQPDRRKQEQPK